MIKVTDKIYTPDYCMAPPLDGSNNALNSLLTIKEHESIQVHALQLENNNSNKQNKW